MSEVFYNGRVTPCSMWNMEACVTIKKPLVRYGQASIGIFDARPFRKGMLVVTHNGCLQYTDPSFDRTSN